MSAGPAAGGPPKGPEGFADATGAPRVATYVGPCERVDLSGITRHRGRLFGRARRKRWLYAAIAADDLYLGVAVVDMGYASNAFAFAADVQPGGGGMLAQASFVGLPAVSCRVGDRPEEGCDARFRGPGASIAIARPVGSNTYAIDVSTRRLEIEARLSIAGAPPPVCAMAHPPRSAGVFTQKRSLLDVTGSARIDGRRRSLDGGLGGLDYTHGFPARDTRWRWAFLLGRSTSGQRVGVNLVEGFNGAVECAVWVDDEAFSVGEGRFTFDAQRPLHPWSIVTTCGAVELTFTPAALHAEQRDLGLVRAAFVQPSGRFRGRIALPGRDPLVVDGAPGVVEDQSVLW